MIVPEFLKNKILLMDTLYKNGRYNKKGFSTKRKIVVFESDDWGSIRMPSKKVYDKLSKIDTSICHHPFFKYDSLATEDDFDCLFDVLSKIKDVNGHNPILTMNCVLANPDFKRIWESDFQAYFYEPFRKTLSRYPGCNNSFSKWKEGIDEGFLYPQYHCREHLNVIRWMKCLREGEKWTRLAFDNEMIGLATCKSEENQNTFMDSFNYDAMEERKHLHDIFCDGAEMFEDTFGFVSQSFIAPCYIWGHDLEETMQNCGVKYIQGEHIQKVPRETNGTSNMMLEWHNLGDKNPLNQIYLIRNVNFEPSWNQQRDWLNMALGGISSAFRHYKPAVISIHRLNFIGSIDKYNRDYNLKLLGTLLKETTRRWPDVEFMTSVELGKVIEGELYHECTG